jgi:alcohol dehydrogenase class IV
VARALGVECGGDHRTDALKGIERIIDLSIRCGIKRRLSDFGIGRDAIPRMATAAMTVTRLLERNPRILTEEDVVSIYEAAW